MLHSGPSKYRKRCSDVYRVPVEQEILKVMGREEVMIY